MTIEKAVMILLGITVIALILNLPFGYLRSKSRKFSLKWLFYIHVPVPFVFLLRSFAGLDYRVIPVILTGAVLGQLLGGLMNQERIS
jgi:predicted cation transporter